VHRSNFKIEGFTEQPSLEELVALGDDASVPVFEDQGTGCVVRLEDYGIEEESSWARGAVGGAALISASGDKLLGGPQCGILVGKRNLIERLRANPLARVLRVDKLTYAALQSTLLAYLLGQEQTIPTIAMLQMDAELIRGRCEAMVVALRDRGFEAETVATKSVIGGGTTPGASLPSFAVALQHPALSAEDLSAALRRLDPPVIARAQQSRLLLDLRTVAIKDDVLLLRNIAELGARQ
jgi:L-seryl-tRNA(Ser) seleniumtransferase